MLARDMHRGGYPHGPVGWSPSDFVFLRRDNGTELFGARVDVAFMAGGELAGAAR